jgi:hypothetical protein
MSWKLNLTGQWKRQLAPYLLSAVAVAGTLRVGTLRDGHDRWNFRRAAIMLTLFPPFKGGVNCSRDPSYRWQTTLFDEIDVLGLDLKR